MREEERGGGAVRIRIRGASSRRPAWWWERDERRGKEGLGLVSGEFAGERIRGGEMGRRAALGWWWVR